MSLKSLATSMAFGASVVFNAACVYAAPSPDLTVSEWAGAKRFLSAESGTKFPGKWQNDRVPYLVEIMDVSGVNHPNPRTAIRGSAQSAKTEVGLNVIGHCIDMDPRPIMAVLPSKDEATKFNNVKFDQMVEATPAVRAKVMASRQRSESGSTTAFKRFRAGFLIINNAGTSKGFQMVSVGLLVLEELAEYEDDVDNRGPADAQARKRGLAWGDDFKEIDISTAGEEGSCKITAAFVAGDQRFYLIQCPHCGDFSALEFENMHRHEGRVVMACPSCGALIDHHHKTAMLAGGVWIAYFKSDNVANPAPPPIISPDDVDRWRARDTKGRYRSYHIWQAYSPFSTWETILNEWDEINGDPGKVKTFFQQILALPYTPQIDKPMAEELHAASTPDAATGEVKLPVVLTRRAIPDFAPILTLACDQQGDRLEWAGWAWGPNGVGVRLDWGVISGVPAEIAVWNDFYEHICLKRYETETMGPLGWDAIGVDTGGRFTQTAYQFCAAHRGEIMALKGKPNDRFAPAITVSAKGVKARMPGGGKRYLPLYLIGTDGLKAKAYHGLSQIPASIDAKQVLPGTLMLTPDSSLESFKQLTAENPVPQKNGGIKWEKIAYQANEQLDLLVYCQAMASELGVPTNTAEQWVEIFEARRKANAIIGAGPLEVLMREEPAPPKPKPAVNTRNSEDVLKVLLAGAGVINPGGGANG